MKQITINNTWKLPMPSRLFTVCHGVFALCVFAPGVWAQSVVPVPNASFESPLVGPPLYAAPQIDSWEKTPEPPGYDTNVFGPWIEKTGVFFNFPSPQPIDNVDGNQAAFLFAFPGAGFFQDYESVGGTNSMPSNEFDASYEIGRGYRLQAGFTTSTTYPVSEGSTLSMRMYYRDGTNRVTVAENTVTFSTNAFSNPFHLIDSEVVVPVVQAGDSWAGQRIGIEFVSTVAPQLIGGVWDLDNVRLSDFAVWLQGPVKSGGQFQFTIHSVPGGEVEILRTTNVSSAVVNWSSLGTVTNTLGSVEFVDVAPPADAAFYSARLLPGE